MNEDFELSPEERAALSALSHEAPPPAALEQRTLHALRARGLVRPPAHRPLRLALAMAAALLLFLSGFAVGRRTSAQDSGVSYAAQPGTPSGQRLVVWF
ncbi:MAG: hypothetical protein HOP28_02055 [Gemmatimonadales bacterium]|nr:hypothetical protein [Gemmatimonadales bacterium]